VSEVVVAREEASVADAALTCAPRAPRPGAGAAPGQPSSSSSGTQLQDDVVRVPASAAARRQHDRTPGAERRVRSHGAEARCEICSRGSGTFGAAAAAAHTDADLHLPPHACTAARHGASAAHARPLRPLSSHAAASGRREKRTERLSSYARAQGLRACMSMSCLSCPSTLTPRGIGVARPQRHACTASKRSAVRRRTLPRRIPRLAAPAARAR
jgi:hypothetical protein